MHLKIIKGEGGTHDIGYVFLKKRIAIILLNILNIIKIWTPENNCKKEEIG